MKLKMNLDTPAARPGDEFLITVPYYWGKGTTITQARQQVKATGGKLNGHWRLYSVAPDTFVNELGQLNYPVLHEPITLAETCPNR